MNAMRNPLLLLILNYIVGTMVARGVIQPNDHNTVVEYMADLVGLAIIMLTTIVSLVKVLRHKVSDDQTIKNVPALTSEQHTTLTDLLNTQTAKTVVNISADTVSANAVDGGTPPPAQTDTPPSTSPINVQVITPSDPQKE